MDTRNEVEGVPEAQPATQPAPTPAVDAGGVGANAPGQTPPQAAPAPEARPELFEPEPEASAQPASLPELSSRPVGSHESNIDLLMDVTVSLTVELGGVELQLREILALGPNSVVKLSRSVDEPVDILVNRELVARGEVVVVDDEFGVRITELVKAVKSRSGETSS